VLEDTGRGASRAAAQGRKHPQPAPFWQPKTNLWR
jgi:hypothetical protein